MKLSKSRRLLGFWLDGHGVHSREDLLSEEKTDICCVECVAVPSAFYSQSDKREHARLR